MARFVDVSHPIREGMKTYPGLPEPRVEVLLDYDDSAARYQHQAEFFIASLHACGNTGTYVDSPCHRHRGAADLSELPLSSLADLRVVIIDAREAPERGLGPEWFQGHDLAGAAVLIETGWSRHWGTDAYFGPNPFLTAAASGYLAAAGVRFAGIDSLNIDDTADLARPAHTILLDNGIPVCEHLTNLDAVTAGGRLHAVPIPWVGGATFPVRAYVVYPE